MEGVNIFIRDAKLPQQMGKRVRSFFEYSLQKRNNGLFNYDADEILSELSAQLKNEIITWVERDLIERIPFFKGKSQSFVADCIQLFQPMVVHEGDFIIKEGAAADEMYFLIKGRAAIYYGQKKVKALVEGSYFGEIGCILGGIRRAGIKAITTCELQCLNKRNLNNLLGEYQEVGEDLKKVARDRMKAVRTTQKQKSVTVIKKLLSARERRLSAGLVIPNNTRLSDLGGITEEEEEGGDGKGKGKGKAKNDKKEEGSSKGGKRGGGMGGIGARQLSMTTANITTHMAADAATLSRINNGHDVGGSPQRDNLCKDEDGEENTVLHGGMTKEEVEAEVNRLVEERVGLITEKLMKGVEANMGRMLKRAEEKGKVKGA